MSLQSNFPGTYIASYPKKRHANPVERGPCLTSGARRRALCGLPSFSWPRVSVWEGRGACQPNPNPARQGLSLSVHSLHLSYHLQCAPPRPPWAPESRSHDPRATPTPAVNWQGCCRNPGTVLLGWAVFSRARLAGLRLNLSRGRSQAQARGRGPCPAFISTPRTPSGPAGDAGRTDWLRARL